MRAPKTAVVLTIVLAAACTDATRPELELPDPPPSGGVVWTASDTGLIAFVSEREGGPQVWIMRADGSDQTRLTFNGLHNQNPDWSPDGTRLVFACHEPGPQDDICVMDADGSGFLRIDTPSRDSNPRWSPNGERILFMSDRLGTQDLFTMAPDGSDATLLFGSSAQDQGPAWSPNGSRVAFHSSLGTANVDVYVLEVATGALTRITDHPAQDVSVSWSPDGTRLAFASHRSANGGLELYTSSAHALEADVAQLTSNASGPRANGRPDWSPDGEWIAFDSNVHTGAAYDVFKLRVADPQVVVNLSAHGANDEQATWQHVRRDPVELSADRDAFLRPGFDDLNEGANPLLHLGEQRRLVVGFDLSDLPLALVESATLVLTIEPSNPPSQWGPGGRALDAHRLRAPWTEGNGRTMGVPYAERTRGAGAGVTWHCASDAAIENQRADCDPRWDGGDFDPTPSDTRVVENGAVGELTFDVTSDVSEGFGSWLLKKTQGHGNARFYTREGAQAAGNAALAPRLVITWR